MPDDIGLRLFDVFELFVLRASGQRPIFLIRNMNVKIIRDVSM